MRKFPIETTIENIKILNTIQESRNNNLFITRTNFFFNLNRLSRFVLFFQPTKLNVYKNDAESWDYTTPTLGEFLP